MKPVTFNPIIFYFFIFTLAVLLLYSVIVSFLYFSRWFKDVVLFIDSQNRWDLKYINSKGLDELSYNGGTYIIKGKSTPPLNKSGKALFKFSVGNPEPETFIHSDAREIDSKTIMSIINNKIVQILMSLQGNFMAMQSIGMIASVVGAISGVLIALKVYGVIK